METYVGPQVQTPLQSPQGQVASVCWGRRPGCGAWEGRMSGFPQAGAESQAAIWLSLAQGSRGLSGAGPVAGWGQGHWGRLDVCV